MIPFDGNGSSEDGGIFELNAACSSISVQTMSPTGSDMRFPVEIAFDGSELDRVSSVRFGIVEAAIISKEPARLSVMLPAIIQHVPADAGSGQIEVCFLYDNSTQRICTMKYTYLSGAFYCVEHGGSCLPYNRMLGTCS